MSEGAAGSFDNARKERSPADIANDLRRVGKDKPMGYLPMGFFLRYGGMGQLLSEARSKGLKIKRFGSLPLLNKLPKSGPVLGTGSLYFYDRQALGDLLIRNEAILKKSGWPTDPDKFVIKSQGHLVQPKTELFDVIADAFADYKNPNRLRPGKHEETFSKEI